MKIVNLISQEYTEKTGKTCPHITPNITEDTLFVEDGIVIGFYIRSIEGKLKKLLDIANTELQSKRVPKSVMGRTSGQRDNEKSVQQYSCIIGAVPPRPHNRRPYPGISSVHSHKSAKMFIKAMIMAEKEIQDLIKKHMPEQYQFQVEEIRNNVPEKYRLGKLFTSSISNCNISANYHTDNANLKGCVNAIIYKKSPDASGGHLHVPEYGITIEAVENSILVYPAWKNLHGVTPITTASSSGYRNSLIFYPLSSFKKYVDAKE